MRLAQGVINFDKLEGISVGGGTSFFAGSDITEIISSLIPYIFGLAGSILLLYLIYGGFSFLTSGGDPKKTQVAKSILTNAIVGIMLIIFAYTIVQVVALVFGIEEIQIIFNT